MAWGSNLAAIQSYTRLRATHKGEKYKTIVKNSAVGGQIQQRPTGLIWGRSCCAGAPAQLGRNVATRGPLGRPPTLLATWLTVICSV